MITRREGISLKKGSVSSLGALFMETLQGLGATEVEEMGNAEAAEDSRYSSWTGESWTSACECVGGKHGVCIHTFFDKWSKDELRIIILKSIKAQNIITSTFQLH